MYFFATSHLPQWHCQNSMNAPLVLNHKCLGVSSVIALEEQESKGIPSVPGNYPV